LLALYEGSIIAVQHGGKEGSRNPASAGRRPPPIRPSRAARCFKTVYSGYWMRAFAGTIHEWPAMHDIKSIRDNPAAFDAGLKRRGLAPLSASLLAIDEKRRAAILASEQAQARRNAASKEIGDAKKTKDEARVEADGGSRRAQDHDAGARTGRENRRRGAGHGMAAIPNLPSMRCPTAQTSTANVQRAVFGKARDYGFAPKPHDDLGGALGSMDFEVAAKLSGARFVVLKKGLARLERAIGQFMLDLHTGEHGYTEINPPLLVRNDVMFGTGQLPKLEDDQF
jgi:seryl-tRNA synthetase